jgi:hypothetical protein
MNITKNYENLRKMVLKMEADIKKIASGQRAGGKRARKTLMEIKKLAHQMRGEIMDKIRY